MDILGTERFSESINIKPVTKDRLNANPYGFPIQNRKGWKSMLKTGDVVVAKGRVWHYISENDYFGCGYDRMFGFDMITRDSGRCRDGILIRSYKDQYENVCMYHMREDSMDGEGIYKIHISEIRRYKSLPPRLGKSFFDNKSKDEDKTVLLYKESDGVTESINIKPVTRGRLFDKSMIDNKLGWKELLESGDVVGVKREGEMQATQYVFLSYDDMAKFDYAKVFYLGRSLDRDMKEGIMLRRAPSGDRFFYFCVSDFSCVDGSLCVGASRVCITEICRSKSTPKQPFTREYVSNIETEKPSFQVIYKKSGGLTESINIKPVTKNRMKDIPLVKYESASDMRKNLKTGDILIISSASGVGVGVFVSAKDLAEQKYKDIVKNLTHTSNINDKDGCIIEKQHNYHLRRAALMGGYDDNLQSYGQKVEKVYRMPNNPLEERNFAEPLISKSVLIWNR